MPRDGRMGSPDSRFASHMGSFSAQTTDGKGRGGGKNDRLSPDTVEHSVQAKNAHGRTDGRTDGRTHADPIAGLKPRPSPEAPTRTQGQSEPLCQSHRTRTKTGDRSGGRDREMYTSKWLLQCTDLICDTDGGEGKTKWLGHSATSVEGPHGMPVLCKCGTLLRGNRKQPGKRPGTMGCTLRGAAQSEIGRNWWT